MYDSVENDSNDSRQTRATTATNALRYARVTASEVAQLIDGTTEGEIAALLTETQRQQIEGLRSLLDEPGWRPGIAKSGVAVKYKYNKETGLFFSCFTTEVPDTAQSLFEDFAAGSAQQRYSDMCRLEEVLENTPRDFPLGDERLVRGYYVMPYPMQDRDFIWREWSALLPADQGGSLYISMAQTPDDQDAICAPEPKYVRGCLRLSATLAYQESGSSTSQMAFIIQGDIRGNMPKSVQNLVAGRASTFLASFRDAHTSEEARAAAAAAAVAEDPTVLGNYD